MLAFKDAFVRDPEAAMKITSIGKPQLLGLHYRRLGYKTVGEMWDDFKRGEFEQASALVRFFFSDDSLYNALLRKDSHTVATLYNGAAYKEMAKKWGREPYNISLRKAYDRYGE